MDTVLYYLAESLRIIALVLTPIMPQTAAKMREALGFAEEQVDIAHYGQWGLTKPGTSIALGQPLFPRLDKAKKKETAKVAATPAKTKAKSKEDDNLLSFDDFKKLDLRVAEIIAAEKIEKSDRLLKLTVKAPEERTVVAGIAEHYEPDQIIGKQVILVANLKPAKLMGVTSHGMILAAKTKGEEKEKLVLCGVSSEVAPGSSVS